MTARRVRPAWREYAAAAPGIAPQPMSLLAARIWATAVPGGQVMTRTVLSVNGLKGSGHSAGPWTPWTDQS